MLQLLKETHARLIAAALQPQRTLVNLRYRLRNLHEAPKHSVPKRALQGLSKQDSAFKQMSFTFAIIALAARIACADGLTREKYAAFREAFPLKGHLCARIRSLFVLACEDTTPVEHYVAQIRGAFPGRNELFASLVGRLFSVAAANGNIARPTEKLLANIAHLFGIKPTTYAEMSARYLTPTAHQLLGVNKHANPDTLKKSYRNLMRRWHPDRFAAERLSPEVELLLKLKASEINAAYRAMARRAA